MASFLSPALAALGLTQQQTDTNAPLVMPPNPNARMGPYQTQLTPQEEQQFRQWLAQNAHIPQLGNFNPNNPNADYDMRGFWKAVQQGDPRAKTSVNPSDQMMHFTDVWKTPYERSFSAESQYAMPNAPRWKGSDEAGWYLQDQGGKVIADERMSRQPKVEPNTLSALGLGGPPSAPPSQSGFNRALGFAAEASPELGALQQLGQRFSQFGQGEQARQQQFAQQFAQDPRQAIQATPEELQRNLNMALAFGGADITKEQKAAWEAENEAFRRGFPDPHGKGKSGLPVPGTRVYIRPSKEFAKLTDPFAEGSRNFNGVVIEPQKMPLADKLGWDPLRGESQSMTPPSPDHVAVQFERPREGGSGGYWFWRHRDSLEVLPPKSKFPVGTVAQYKVGGYIAQGVVMEPPPNAPPSPGPDYVWMDVHGDYWPPLGEDVTRYRGNAWGSWFHRDDLAEMDAEQIMERHEKLMKKGGK